MWESLFNSSPGVSECLGRVAPTGTISIYDGTTLISGPDYYLRICGIAPTPTLALARKCPRRSRQWGPLGRRKYSGDASYALLLRNLRSFVLSNSTAMTMNVSSTNVQYGDRITVSATVNTG